MSIATLKDEISTAREQLVALIDETTFELWEQDLETDLLGLALKMAEWERILVAVERERAQ